MIHSNEIYGNGQKIIGFDYGILTTVLQKEMQEEAAAIQKLIVQASRNVVQIGLRLLHVHECLGRGKFNAWLFAEFRWHRSTASNYMRAAAQFGDVPCLDRFQPSALYILSRKKATNAARDEAIVLANKGGLVTKAAAVNIVRRHHQVATKRIDSIDKKYVDMLKKLEGKVSSLSAAGKAQVSKRLTSLLALLNADSAASEPAKRQRVPPRNRRSSESKQAAVTFPSRSPSNSTPKNGSKRKL